MENLRIWMRAAPLPMAMAVVLACLPLALFWNWNPWFAFWLTLATSAGGFLAGCLASMAMDGMFGDIHAHDLEAAVHQCVLAALIFFGLLAALLPEQELLPSIIAAAILTLPLSFVLLVPYMLVAYPLGALLKRLCRR